MLGALTVAAPLSFLRDLSALSIASYITFLMTVCLTIVIMGLCS